jgi:hypothetical protein
MKILSHPVMGWYVITLLIVIVGVIPLYFLGSPVAAKIWSYGGTILVVASFLLRRSLTRESAERRR